MIAYFPELYEDELLYSILSRYVVHKGIAVYRSAAEELFTKPKEFPEKEFINALQPEILERLCKGKPLEQIIMEHTMTPYYIRFLPKEKRKKARARLIRMEGDYKNLLAIPKMRLNRNKYLRYCPQCVKEDREKYGETYWHRKHQIYGVDVCSVHGCRLEESPVRNDTKTSPEWMIAENIVEEKEVRYGTEGETAFARYIMELLDREVLWENEVDVGTFLSAKLSESQYTSIRGKQRKLTLLFYDFKIKFEYCQEGIVEQWQIEKVLAGHRKNPLEICQIAYFLNIPMEELINPKDMGNMEEIFDEKVVAMIRDGKSLNGIARELGVSSGTIRKISRKKNVKSKGTKEKTEVEEREYQARIQEERKLWKNIMQKNPNTSYTQLCKNPEYRYHLMWLRRNDEEWTDKNWMEKQSYKPIRQDWDRIDRETLPLVKEAVHKLQGTGIERPKKITCYAVERMLNLPNKRLDLLPRCKQEILQYQESQEEYWARELIWGIEEIQRRGEIVNYKNVRKVTNMRREYINACYPYICQSGKQQVIEIAERLMNY